MTSAEILASDMFVTRDGGILEYFDPATGDILMECRIPPGLVAARDFIELCPVGAAVRAGEGLVVVPKRGRARSGAVGYGQAHYDSAANPAFRPGSADPLRREMELMVARMRANEKRIEARFAALSKVDRVPKAPVQTDPAPVEPPIVE